MSTKSKKELKDVNTGDEDIKNQSIIDRILKVMETPGNASSMELGILATKLSSKNIRDQLTRNGDTSENSPAANLINVVNGKRCDRATEYNPLSGGSGCKIDGAEYDSIYDDLKRLEEESRVIAAEREENRIRCASEASTPYDNDKPSPNQKRK